MTCKYLRIAGASILTLCLVTTIADAKLKPYPDRVTFCHKFAGIGTGVSAAEVERILGPPDDIVTERDVGVMGLVGTDTVWCYGTNGHRTFPTLGCVHLGKGKVTWVIGGAGSPPPRGMFDEASLRPMLRLIDETGDSFNPRGCIAVVDTLIPLGKTKALAVLYEYARTSGERDIFQGDCIFWIDRSLFEVPTDKGYFPRPELGATMPEAPHDLRLIPGFPLIVVGDVPIMLPVGWTLDGVPEPPSMDLDYFRDHGVMRGRPLTPPDDPTDIPAKVARICQAAKFDMPSEMVVSSVKEQIVDLVDPSLEHQGSLGWRDQENVTSENWQTLQREFAVHSLVWNPSLNRYTTKSGTYTAVIPRPTYLHSVWRPRFGQSAPVIDIVRDSPRSVSITISHATGVAVEQEILFRVVRVDPEGSELFRYVIPVSKAGDHGGEVYSTGFDAPIGASIRVLATQGSLRQASPTYTP